MRFHGTDRPAVWMPLLAVAVVLGPALNPALNLALTGGAGAHADTLATTDLPQSIAGQPVVELATGLGHSCARLEDRTVWCWGRNDRGQLGDGTTTDRPNPARVQGLTSVVRISLGQGHGCALRTTGRVFCWGANNFGQLGDGSTTDRLRPTRVRALADVTEISAGRLHSCAVRASGRAFCWGDNFWGQLGDGTYGTRLSPVRVEGPASSEAVAISAGGDHTCLLRQNGRVACWGRNNHGQLGNGFVSQSRARPAPILTLNNVRQIAVGGAHSCALRSTGRVFCWGTNANGQLGDGTTASRSAPVRVLRVTMATDIAAGSGTGHSCAVRGNGNILCWGANTSGALGDGTTITRYTPVRVNGIADAVQVAAGSGHSCGLRANGRAFCWGNNQYGQIGDGTTLNRLTAVRVLDD